MLATAYHLWALMLPLYGVVALGVLARQWLGLSQQPFATFVIYLVVPLVVFVSIARMPLQPMYFALPIAIFILAAGMSIGMYRLAQRYYDDATPHLIGQASGTANTGYFGVPLFLALVGEAQLGVYLLAIQGMLLCESTICYYLIARGQASVRQALRKVVRLPTMYAVVLGLCVNVAGWPLPAWLIQIESYFRGCYVILGMVIIGLALGNLKGVRLGKRFLPLILGQKFILWPLLTLTLVLLDGQTLQLFDDLARTILFLVAIMPLAANTVAYASQTGVETGKAAYAVFLSTIAALFIVPLYLVLAQQSGWISFATR